MRGRGLGIVASLVLLGASSLALAAPADAGTPGPTVSLGTKGSLEYLKATFDDVASQAGAPADCGVGDIVTGGGGSISGSGSSAALNASYPESSAGEAWVAEGSITGGGGRKVATYAICGQESYAFNYGTSPVGAAGEINDVVTVSDSCGSDPLIGGGVQGEGGNVRIVESRPADGVTGWTSIGQNAADVDGEITGWRACSTAYDPHVRADSTKVKPGKSGKTTARCEGGEAVLQGGVSSTSSGSPARDTWVTSIRPFDSKDNGKTPEDGWTVKAYNDSDGRAKLSAYAVCVEP